MAGHSIPLLIFAYLLAALLLGAITLLVIRVIERVRATVRRRRASCLLGPDWWRDFERDLAIYTGLGKAHIRKGRGSDSQSRAEG